MITNEKQIYRITEIHTPNPCNKYYEIGYNKAGLRTVLKKKSPHHMYKGEFITREFTDIEGLEGILKEIRDKPNSILIMDHLNVDHDSLILKGDNPLSDNEPIKGNSEIVKAHMARFKFLSHKSMLAKFGKSYDTGNKPLIIWNGELYTSRSKHTFKPEHVIGIDIDDCTKSAGMSAEQVIGILEGYCPELKEAGRVMTSSNSARVALLPTDFITEPLPTQNNAHVFYLTSGGDRNKFLRTLAGVMVADNVYYDQSDNKTIFDPSVGGRSREWYEGCITLGAGLVLRPKLIQSFDGGLLDLSKIVPADNETIERISERPTNTSKIHNMFLQPETIIETEEYGLIEWSDPRIQNMSVEIEKLKCQVPDCIRTGSTSWNGILRHERGEAYLYDNGSGIKYTYRSMTVQDMFGDVASSGAISIVGVDRVQNEIDSDEYAVDAVLGDEYIKSENVFAQERIRYENEVVAKLRDAMQGIVLETVTDLPRLRHMLKRVFIHKKDLYALHGTQLKVKGQGETHLMLADFGIEFNLESTGLDGDKLADTHKRVNRLLKDSVRSATSYKAIDESKSDLFIDHPSIDTRSNGEIVTISRPFEKLSTDWDPIKDKAYGDSFKEYTKGFSEELIDFVLAARGAGNRRRGNLIIEAPRGWGKDAFVFGGLNLLATDVDYRELSLGKSGNPSGLSAALVSNFAMVFNEVRFIPAIAKEIDSTFSFAEKGKPRINVDVYSKILMSANPIDEIDRGSADPQLLDRFSYIKLEGRLDDVPLFKANPSKYIHKLNMYYYWRANNWASCQRAMGKEESLRVNDIALNDFHKAHSLGHTIGELSDVTIKPLLDDAIKAIESVHELGGGRLKFNEAYALGDGDRDDIKLLSMLIVRTKDVILKTPMAFMELWIKTRAPESQIKTIMRVRNEAKTILINGSIDQEMKHYKVTGKTIKGLCFLKQ